MRPGRSPASALLRSWERAFGAIGRDGDAALRDRLLGAWGEPHRRYHTRQHLLECIQALDPHLDLARHPGEVELALWFHDAILEVHRTDNEARSAAWAKDALASAGVARTAAARVHDLVLATRHRARPRSIDARLVVDADLAILGAPPTRFARYEAQVRQEYAWVPEPLFRARRLELLREFLARRAIYCTAPFRARLELAARRNLEASIRRLQHAPRPTPSR